MMANCSIATLRLCPITEVIVKLYFNFKLKKLNLFIKNLYNCKKKISLKLKIPFCKALKNS